MGGVEILVLEMGIDANILSLAEKAYGAIDGDERNWDEFVSELAGKLDTTHLFLIDFRSQTDAEVLGAFGRNSQAFSTFLTSASDVAATIIGACRGRRTGEVRSVPWSDDLDRLEALIGVEAAAISCCGIEHDDINFTVLVFASCRSANDWTSDEKELISRLSIHLARAIRTARQLRAERTRTGTVLNVIDRLDTAAALLNTCGRVVFVNKALQRVLASRDGLELCQDRLLPTAAKALRLFEQNVIEAARTDDAFQPLYISLPRPSGGRPLQLSIGAISAQPNDDARKQDRQLLVLVSDPDAMPGISADALQQLFGVTGREAEVIAQLTYGQNLGEAAENLGISRDTVTVHIKHALAKTGTRRQAELVALALRSPARQLKPI